MYVIDSISSYEYKIKSSKFFSYIYKISELHECKNKLLELKVLTLLSYFFSNFLARKLISSKSLITRSDSGLL